MSTTTSRQAQFTRDDLAKELTINIPDDEGKQAFLRDPYIALALDICYATASRPQQCVENAENGRDYLRARGYEEVEVALGFMVIHEYWRIRMIEHGWLVIGDGEDRQVIDPTLPFLSIDRVPTYFQGAIHLPNGPLPTLRNRAYKAVYQQAKHFAETCEYDYHETAPRRVRIVRFRRDNAA